MKKFAFIWLLIAVNMGAAFAQNYVNGDSYKYWTSLEDLAYRSLRIQTTTNTPIDNIGTLYYVRATYAGDTKIVTVVNVCDPTDKNYRKDKKQWKKGDKTTIEEIMKDDWNITEYTIKTPNNGYFVEFGGWGEKDFWTKVNNRKFGVIMPYSTVRVSSHCLMRIESGAVGWDDDFQAVNNLDDYMEYLAKKVDYDWVKKKVDSYKKLFAKTVSYCPEDPDRCKCKGDIYEHIIINATNRAMGWGMIWGLAPPFLMPAEFVNVQAQYTIQTYLAAAIGYCYGKFPKGGDAFVKQLKLDNYVLFADTAGGEHLSDIGKGMRETGVTEIITKGTELIMKKIAPKGLSSVPVVGTIWGIGKGAWDGRKYAQEMGKRAVEFYSMTTPDKLKWGNVLNVSSANATYGSSTGKMQLVEAANKAISGAVGIPGTYVGNPIEAKDFIDCIFITSVTILDGAISISTDAFRGCANLTSVTIPASVNVIGGNAFLNCNKLTSVTLLANTYKRFDDNAFPGDLVKVFKSPAGGAGTYTRQAGSNAWKKKN